MNPNLIDQFLQDTNTPLSILMERETPLPQNEYREASLAFMRVIRLAIEFIIMAENPKLAAIGVGYTLRLPNIIGISMRARSKALGISHNTLSYYVQGFKKLLEL